MRRAQIGKSGASGIVGIAAAQETDSAGETAATSPDEAPPNGMGTSAKIRVRRTGGARPRGPAETAGLEMGPKGLRVSADEGTAAPSAAVPKGSPGLTRQRRGPSCA